MGKVREFFENSGFEPADIPKAFIIHELLGMGFAAAAWGVRFFRHNDSQTEFVRLNQLKMVASATYRQL